jgi:hypothetical protein
MIKTNISEILKPVAEEIRKAKEHFAQRIKELEISAMTALEMDCTFETNGKLFIKIYPNTGAIEIRHRTNDGTYYYYPLYSDHTDPKQCKPKQRIYMFDPKKTYKKGWKKK